MFTVKMRDLKQGHENIFEARRVEWINEPIINGTEFETAPGLLIHYEDASNATHYGVSPNEDAWQCWVMNRDGATVAQYRF